MINKGDYTGYEASMTVHKGAIQHILSVSQEKGKQYSDIVENL